MSDKMLSGTTPGCDKSCPVCKSRDVVARVAYKRLGKIQADGTIVLEVPHFIIIDHASCAKCGSILNGGGLRNVVMEDDACAVLEQVRSRAYAEDKQLAEMITAVFRANGYEELLLSRKVK